jgi:hypothetical protein
MSGNFIRRTAVLIAAVAAVALVAAPAALANQDTIKAAAGVPFSGAVDSFPSCTPTSATINWGDGAVTPGTYDSTNIAVTGSHTYGAAGTFSGTVTLVGSDCTGLPADTFTATVASAPQFTQCPAVGLDFGCQFLIDITPGGTVVLQDTNQGAYEGSEDALIGVKNDSSSPLSSIPIASPGSDVFSFDGDGLCDNGSSTVPSGCQLIGATAGTPCDRSGPCAFPAVPGQPGANPDPYTGSTQNGYEGPQNYFSNVSADTSSGVVNFSPPLQPGQSTYFSLEEPPSAAAINVGSTPVGGGLTAPPTVTATSASFVAIVNPNGSATSAQFQFSLDPHYGPLASFSQLTPSQAVGGDFGSHVVSATVHGLVPNAIYHVHLVATNKNGQTLGSDVTFRTKAAPAPGSPTVGKTFNTGPVTGLVLVKVHGVFRPITQALQFPVGSIIDALGGSVTIITAASGHPASDAAAKGKKHKSKVKTQSGRFGGAIFKVAQAHNGLATLSLVENAFPGAPSFATCKAHKSTDATAAALSSRTLQFLRASAHGSFSTRGRYGAATVRGTKWTTADRCDGTFIHDLTDSVAVTDFVRHKTIILHAGGSYLAKKKP